MQTDNAAENVQAAEEQNLQPAEETKKGKEKKPVNVKKEILSWILTLGGRYDHVDIEIGRPTGSDEATFTDFTKRIGLTYKIDPDLSALLGQTVTVTPRNGTPRKAEALDIDEDCRLVVRFAGEHNLVPLRGEEVHLGKYL